MASFGAGLSRGKDTTDRSSGIPTVNRLSTSLLEPRDNTVADIWRYSQREQQRFDPDAMNESVDRQREMRRNTRPTNRMSFGVMENSPVPREETTSRVLNNERIRKSIGLLDQATGKFATPGPPMARTPGSGLKHSTYTPRKPPMTSQFDVSQTIGVTPNRSFTTPATLMNMSRFDQSRLNASLLTTPAYQQDMSGAGLEPTNTPGDLTEAFTSTNIQLLLEEDPGVAATEGVYEEFQSCFKRHASQTEVFKLVEEYERACNEQVTLLYRLVHRAGPSQNKFSRTIHVLSELEQEKKTWRLIGSLYSDRINSMESIPTMDMDIASQTTKHSEHDIMKDLFENNASVRQDQLIVDWLERNAADQLSRTYDKTEFYSKSVCWENTLHELQQKSASLSSSERSSVAHLDPDAPIRENKPLADLDKEDEVRLLREVFMMVRAGQMEEAQRLCKKCGQAWRAATLEGWRLYHDQNMKEVAASGDLAAVAGNPYRDIWKAVCWRMAEDERFNVFERAIYAALSGNLRELLPACEYWEDCMWAYFKVMVDQNVEASIREKLQISREMEPLPPVYHEKDLTPSKIFQELQAHPSTVVEQQARERHRVIQKYIILADLDALIEEMGEWLRDDGNQPSSHMKRFMAHVVLFLRSVGLQTKEEICVAIMESFVKDLISEKRIKLVATYAAQLPNDMQISWYANFLEGVQAKDERQHCLQLAEEMGLDVPLITKTVVENIRTRDDDSDMGERTPALEAATSEEDRHKIEAIDWLVFDPSQRAEALKQSNAIIRMFLASKKHDAAREVFSKIPEDSIDVIHRNWQATAAGSAHLLAEDENAIREYLCVRAYLNALDAFNDWFEHYHNRRPTAPVLPDRANFHEKVRYEHEHKEHEMELDRWQHALNIQSQGVVDTINNVLLFVDGGWMVDQRTDCEEDECRQQQLEGLRQLCIPMLCQLLHSVLHTTGRYRECVALADTIASDQYELYKVFNCAELQQFLGKLRESSLQLLDRDLDPLGYEISS